MKKSIFRKKLQEDFCGWISNKSKNYLLESTLKIIQKYTNLNHSCPYNGTIFLKVNSVSVRQLTFAPLLPAGRYRVDINFTDDTRHNNIFMGKLFFSVADDRIEKI